MSKPIHPPLAAGSGNRKLLAYASNALVGLRVPAAPLTAGLALLSGCTGEHPDQRIGGRHRAAPCRGGPETWRRLVLRRLS
jgi:hypothetical protein